MVSLGAMATGVLVQALILGERAPALHLGVAVARIVAQAVTPAATELVVIGVVTQPHHVRAIVTATAVLAVVRPSTRLRMVLRAVIN